MSAKTYKRDNRSPKPKDANTSALMSKVKAKNTIPELIVRRFLYESGFRGYRLNYKKVIGRPDICFTVRKAAIFVHGCFWHRCPKCNFALPKNNTSFWMEKFRKNMNRDELKTKELKASGWKVIVLWECDLKRDDRWKSKLINNLS